MAARKSRSGGSSRFGRPIPFNQKNIKQLPDDKPIIYEGLGSSGTNLYTGRTKRGRGRERLMEHLNTGDLPGVKKIRIKQVSSIGDAKKEEQRIIKKENPKLNK